MRSKGKLFRTNIVTLRAEIMLQRADWFETVRNCWEKLRFKAIRKDIKGRYDKNNDILKKSNFFPPHTPCGPATQRGSWPPHSWGFLDHTQQRTKVGRAPLDEWSAHRRDLYLTTHNTHNRLTSMPPVGFEPTISAGERPQTYALDRVATGTG